MLLFFSVFYFDSFVTVQQVLGRTVQQVLGRITHKTEINIIPKKSSQAYTEAMLNTVTI